MSANFVLSQIGWFACVLGGARDWPWLGTSIALMIVGWHVARAARPREELILVLLAAGIGAVFDSVLVAAGWVEYASGTLLPGTAPHWIIASWMLFAATLNVSLRWLRRSRLAAVALGAVGGPLAYWSGARLGAMAFVAPIAATTAIAIGWTGLTPFLMWLAQRFDGYDRMPAAGTPSEPRHA